MKKLLFILFTAIIFSCSSDDDTVDPNANCDVKVWSLQSGDEKYSLSYGPTQNDTQSVDVNKATYDFYYELAHSDNKSEGNHVCWEGFK